MPQLRVRYEGPPALAGLLAQQLTEAGYPTQIPEPPDEYRSLNDVVEVVTLVVDGLLVGDRVRTFLTDWRTKHPHIDARLEDDWREGRGYL